MPSIVKWEEDFGEREDGKKELARKFDHPFEVPWNYHPCQQNPRISSCTFTSPGTPSFPGTVSDTNLTLSNLFLTAYFCNDDTL